jgi:uncharacterized protein DUF3179
MGSSFDPSPESGGRRLKILLRVTFVLLALHFLAVYLLPERVFYQRPDKDARARGSGPSALAGAGEKTYTKDGKRFLRASAKPAEHFDITTFRLNTDGLHYGIGREAFPALIEPAFVSVADADRWLGDNDRVLAVKVGREVKVYPIELLIRHEVVNDVVGGRAIFAAYCILADLGAVYDRRLGRHTLTFALTGYTYAHAQVWDGRDAFVLWDRETESLWWPPIGKAVSGSLIDHSLKLLESDLWKQTVWGEVKGAHPYALVLQRGQDMERPRQWRRLDVTAVTTQPTAGSTTAIAPRWGANTTF